MKYKKIMTIFGIITPLCFAVRLLQLVFTVDEKGFSLENYQKENFNMTVVLLIAVFGIVILSMTAHRCPPDPPKCGKSPYLAAASLLLGLWTVYSAFAEVHATVVPKTELLLLYLLSVLCGIVFILYGVQLLCNFRLPPVVFAIPVIYWIIRLVVMFTTLNTLAVTTGHFFMLLSYAAVLIFMLELGKLFAGIHDDYIFRKLLSSGLSAVVLICVYAVANLVLAFTSGEAVVDGTVQNLILAANGIFILLFILTFFNYRNLKPKRNKTYVLSDDFSLCERHHHHRQHEGESSDDSEN